MLRYVLQIILNARFQNSKDVKNSILEGVIGGGGVIRSLFSPSPLTFPVERFLRVRLQAKNLSPLIFQNSDQNASSFKQRNWKPHDDVFNFNCALNLTVDSVCRTLVMLTSIFNMVQTPNQGSCYVAQIFSQYCIAL